ncbi:MAG: hypothetical protein J0G33_02660 [Afipia felis]|nr:hypothetical protein [Afipia felis]
MPSKAELVCVDPARVSEFWPYVRGMIYRAVARGGGDIRQIERDVLSGSDLLWLAWDGASLMAAAVTSLGTVNGMKICTIAACGGSGWPDFGHLLAGIETYAKSEGCMAMRIYGRSGWKRLLKGYRLRSVILEKEI